METLEPRLSARFQTVVLQEYFPLSAKDITPVEVV